LGDGLDEIEGSLCTFLKKTQVENGEAERKAKKYLKLNERERLMEELLPGARKLVEEAPFPSLPQALTELAKEQGYEIPCDDAEDFIKKMTIKRPPPSSPKAQPRYKPPRPAGETVTTGRRFDPEHLPNLHFTKLIEAVFGSQRANNWNALLRCGVELALQRSIPLGRLKALNVPVEKGQKTNDGFSPIRGLDVSVQNVDANRAWSLSLCLAKELQIEVRAIFRWREKDGAAYPGEQGTLHWNP